MLNMVPGSFEFPKHVTTCWKKEERLEVLKFGEVFAPGTGFGLLAVGIFNCDSRKSWRSGQTIALGEVLAGGLGREFSEGK